MVRISKVWIVVVLSLLVTWIPAEWGANIAGAAEAPKLPQYPITPYPPSHQVNVNAAGQNIPGDAANEPSLCVDPTNPSLMAIGWRQFNTVTNDFRQAGWAWSADAGETWTFPGVLETNVFRSDPVLAADSQGRFYFLSLLSTFECDLWQSTNSGVNWQRLASAFGGDKSWMAIDTTAGPGNGRLYEAWSPWFNPTANANAIFSCSTDGGLTWLTPGSIPLTPGLATMDVGPDGTLYLAGWSGRAFVVDRSTNASEAVASPMFDFATPVDLGGILASDVPGINPSGLLGQVWIAADRSPGLTRGNVYVLATVDRTNGRSDIMLSRSTDGGLTWSPAQAINEDAGRSGAWHWFGTLAVAPNGRVDVCWYDTRNSTNNAASQLYYSCSMDGGLNWSANLAVGPLFDQSLGYPTQEKMGDYISMVSLSDAACIAYTATYNGEEDVYFVRVAPPIAVTISNPGPGVRISWNAVIGRTYIVETKGSLGESWSPVPGLSPFVATNLVVTVADPPDPGGQRYYRVVQQP